MNCAALDDVVVSAHSNMSSSIHNTAGCISTNRVTVSCRSTHRVSHSPDSIFLEQPCISATFSLNKCILFAEARIKLVISFMVPMQFEIDCTSAACAMTRFKQWLEQCMKRALGNSRLIIAWH